MVSAICSWSKARCLVPMGACSSSGSMDEVTAMPSTTVYNMAGEAIDKLELSEQVFGVTPNVAVLHQGVTAQLVNRRQGNASTKTRSEGSGGNKKPHRQKGTSRARHGSNRAPQVRHLVAVFGPK